MFPIIALFVMALLVVFTGEVSTASRTNLRLTDLALAEVQAASMARSGIARALATIQADTTLGLDTISDSWLVSPDLEKRVNLSDGLFWIGKLSTSYWNNLNPSVGDTVFGLVDESSKLNLLVHPREVFLDLPSFPPALWSAAQEWKRNHTAQGEYETEGTVPSVDQLTALAGLSLEETAEIDALVTTHGNGKININTASESALNALGVSTSLAKKIHSFRLGRDNTIGTEDDGVFTDLDQIAISLSEQSLSPREGAEISQLRTSGYLDISSHYIRVRSVGQDPRLLARAVVEVVIHRHSDGTLKVVEWREP